MHARAAVQQRPLSPPISVTPAPSLLAQRKCASCAREDEQRQRSSPPDVVRSPSEGSAAALAQLTSPTRFHFGDVRITPTQRRRLQKKTAIGAPGDRFEVEADRVAERILRMPAPQTLRAPVPVVASQTTSPEPPSQRAADGGQTADGEREAVLGGIGRTLQRKATFDAPSPPPAADGIDLSNEGGRPLPSSVRSYFEPRFGYDLSRVRIHDDARAARDAQALSAHAFTVGADIYFAPTSYAPETAEGRYLLAHELTHVIQQGQGAPLARGGDAVPTPTPAEIPSPAPRSIQRICGPAAVGVQAGCVGESSEPAGSRFLFQVNCDDFAPGEKMRLFSLGAAMGPDDRVAIHGFASMDGPEDFNDNLSCLRAKSAESILVSAGVGLDQISDLRKHGATPGPYAERRSVVIEPLAPYQRCECVEELTLRSSGSVEGAHGISQYWTTVTPYWGSDNTLGNFDTAGSGGWRWYGHKFQVVGRFSTRRTLGSPGRATFQQMARLTTTEGGTPGAWFDDMNYTDAGGGAHHWDPNAEAGTTGASGYTGVGRTIAADRHAYTDPPAVGYQSGTTNSYRNLEFQIYFRSAPGCGCPTAELSTTAAEEIRVTNGVPTTLRFP